jgi:hypothetical protein
MRKLVFVMVAALMLMASSAFARGGSSSAAGPKENMLSIFVSHGENEYSDKVGATDDYVPFPGSFPELGVGGEFDKKMAADYQLAIGFEYRWGNFKAEPTSNAAPGTPDAKLTSTSWKVRVGGDRTGEIGDRFHWFMGPGIEYWSGHAKVEQVTSSTGENTNKWGINGRVGGVMMISPTMGVMGRVGDTFGYASVSDTGGKNTWYYSDFEAAWGLQFKLGGK